MKKTVPILKPAILFPILFLFFALLLAGCIETGNKNSFLGEGLAIGDNTPGYHNECRGASCMLVFGEGPDECLDDPDCWEYPCGEDPNNDCLHAACINNACILVSPEGPDECQSNADCSITHLECENQQCVPIQGSGQDQCTTNNDCITHLACVNQQCVPVQGPGQNECNNNNDCSASLDCNLKPFNFSVTYGAFLNSAQNQYEFAHKIPLIPNGNSWENCYYYQLNTNSPKVLIHPQQKMHLWNGDARMDISNYQVKDLVEYVPTGIYQYRVYLGNPIPATIDFQNGGHAIIPFMGGRYKVLDFNGTEQVEAVKLQNMNKPSEIFWIRNGWPFPYFPDSNTQYSDWETQFWCEGGQTGFCNYQILNRLLQWDHLNPIFPPNNFNNRQPNSADFLDGTGFSKEGFAKIWFDGFNGAENPLLEFKKGVNAAEGTSAISYGAIHYTDSDSGVGHWLPMALKLPATASNGALFSFDGVNQSYWTDSQTDITRLAIDYGSILPVMNPDYNVLVALNDTDYNYSHVVELKGKNERQYKYFARRSTINPNEVWLVLAGYEWDGDLNSANDTYTGYIGSTLVGGLFLLVTVTDESRFDRNYFWNSPAVPIYYPDIYDYNGNQGGSITGKYRTAVFVIREGANGDSIPHQLENNSAQIYIDTELGNSGTIDTAAIGDGTKQNWDGLLFSAANYWNENQDLTSFSEYLGEPNQNSPNYKKAYTDNGSRIELEERELFVKMTAKQTVSLPEKSVVEVKVTPEFDPNPNNKYQLFFQNGFQGGNGSHMANVGLVKNGETIMQDQFVSDSAIIFFNTNGEPSFGFRSKVHLRQIFYPPYRFAVDFYGSPKVFMRMDIKETGLSPFTKPVPVP